MSINWKPEYSVGVREIDEQHKDLVKTIRKLYEDIRDNNAEEEIDETLNLLIDYAKTHFSTEEKYFEKFKYEKTQEHKMEHRAFERKIAKLIKNAEKNKLKVSFDLIDFLEDWLLDHLATQDQEYVDCFKKNGLK